MVTIPGFVVEYFLLGRTHGDAIDRYLQDGGVVTEVWLTFAQDPEASQRVLVAPSKGTQAIDLGYALHRALTQYRAPEVEPVGARPTNDPPNEGQPGVSPLENYVAVRRLYFDELIRVVLPMTRWWHDTHLTAVRGNAHLRELLDHAIRARLGETDRGAALRAGLAREPDASPARQVILAAPVAALIGVFLAAQENSAFSSSLASIPNPRAGGAASFMAWVKQHAETIAQAAIGEFGRPLMRMLFDLPRLLQGLEPEPAAADSEPPALIQRVFNDRLASLADLAEANSTIKADAAFRVFDIKCNDITWAILDTGIAATHPAFVDHSAATAIAGQLPNANAQPPSRIKGIYDFTLMDQIRDFDLTLNPDRSKARNDAISAVATALDNLPGRVPSAAFRREATRRMARVVRQLEERIAPDWGLMEPLIRFQNLDNGDALLADHGTHVAGILAADWRSQPAADGTRQVVLQGVCPDMNVYDLRVVSAQGIKATESAMIAALGFIQYLNARTSDGPVIHGVNISLSIPHDVRNYGCGATPICVASDRLVNSGVVVVAAAGNRGWNEQELGFGNFVLSSITDPGNAHEVITVGSTHRQQPHTYGVSYFSSRGPTGDGRIKPDLLAPGEKIRGPIRGEAYDELSGTSQAAPFVSGAAAMLMARHRELIGHPRRIKGILCDTATDLGRERYFQGNGLLDVLRAMQAV